MPTLRDTVLGIRVQLSDNAINIMTTLRDTVLGTRVQLSDKAINIMPTLRDTWYSSTKIDYNDLVSQKKLTSYIV
jgi:hypothetical protein